MTSTPVRICTHVFTSGKKCNGIALRDSPKCYQHHSHRRMKRSQAKVNLRSRMGRLNATNAIFHAIVANRIDPEVARSMLYAIFVSGNIHPNDL